MSGASPTESNSQPDRQNPQNEQAKLSSIPSRDHLHIKILHLLHQRLGLGQEEKRKNDPAATLQKIAQGEPFTTSEPPIRQQLDDPSFDNGPLQDTVGIISELTTRRPTTIASLAEKFDKTSHTFELASAEPIDEMGLNIGMESFGITDALSEQPIIGTRGTGECGGIILYDASKKAAAVAHFNTSIDPFTSLDEIVQLLGSEAFNLQAYVWGTIQENPLSVELARRLVVALDRKQISIAASDLLNPQTARAGLFIDTRNGKLLANVSQTEFKQVIPPGGGEGFSITAAQAWPPEDR